MLRRKRTRPPGLRPDGEKAYKPPMSAVTANADSKPFDKVMLASILSVATACVLVALKVMTLAVSGSQSILASLADSGLDLVASLVTFFAVRFARTPPDKEHPFGHGKAEAFSALFQAGLVFASGALVLQSCVHSFLHPQPVTHSGLAIGVLVLSLALTAGLITFQNAALKASQSVAVAADRMHYLTDLITNAVALVGVGFAALGFGIMDAVAGVIMALWFIWGAVKVLKEASDHLMDHAMEDADLDRIRTLVLADGRVTGLHDLRTRLAGPYILIQMHIELDPAMTLEAVHHIIIEAEKRLIEVYPNADIIIHADPRGTAEPHSGVFSDDRPDAA